MGLHPFGFYRWKRKGLRRRFCPYDVSGIGNPDGAIGRGIFTMYDPITKYYRIEDDGVSATRRYELTSEDAGHTLSAKAYTVTWREVTGAKGDDQQLIAHGADALLARTKYIQIYADEELENPITEFITTNHGIVYWEYKEIHNLTDITAEYTGDDITVDEEYDKEDVIVTITYNVTTTDSEELDPVTETVPIDEFEVNQTKITRIGDNLFTVNYTFEDIDVTADFIVNGIEKVTNAIRELSDLTAAYNGSDVYVGDEYDKRDVTVTVTYAITVNDSDEVTYETEALDADAFATDSTRVTTVGSNTFHVTFTFNNVTKTVPIIVNGIKKAETVIPSVSDNDDPNPKPNTPVPIPSVSDNDNPIIPDKPRYEPVDPSFHEIPKSDPVPTKEQTKPEPKRDNPTPIEEDVPMDIVPAPVHISERNPISIPDPVIDPDPVMIEKPSIEAPVTKEEPITVPEVRNDVPTEPVTGAPIAETTEEIQESVPERISIPRKIADAPKLEPVVEVTEEPKEEVEETIPVKVTTEAPVQTETFTNTDIVIAAPAEIVDEKLPRLAQIIVEGVVFVSLLFLLVLIALIVVVHRHATRRIKRQREESEQE